MPISNPALAAQISAMVAYWRTRDLEFQAWLAGPADGGPYSNGTYPLTDFLNEVYYAKSPLALEALVDGEVGSASSYADAAEASADAAAASVTAAAASAASALAYRNTASTHKTDAYTYRQDAASSAANAATSASAAAASAAAAAGTLADLEDTLSDAVDAAVAAGTAAAASSASASAGSASAAATSATAASGSATAAAGSATAASGSATAAAGSATAASGDAAAAAASAAAAAASAASIGLTLSSSNTWTADNVYTQAQSGGTYPLKLSSGTPYMEWYETDGGTNSKGWDMGASSEIFKLRLRNDAQNAASDILAVTRSALAVATITIGNTTDNPPIHFKGTLYPDHPTSPYIDFKVNGTNSAYVGLAGGPSDVFYVHNRLNTGMAFGTNNTTRLLISAAGVATFTGTVTAGGGYPQITADGGASAGYLRSANSSANGEVGVMLQNASRTWFIYTTSGDLLFYNTSPFLSISTSGAVSALADDLRSDILYSRSNPLKYLWWNNGPYTYGSAALSGSSGGYVGLVLNEGTNFPTFMAASGTVGIYSQTAGRWEFYAVGGYTSAPYLHHDTSFTKPYLCVVAGGAGAGGRVTISTSGPSGTPADGDVWIQRAA